MPLQTLPSRNYLRCERIHVNSNDRSDQSKSAFDFVVPLDQLYEKVVAFELVSWNVPYATAPCIFSETRLTSPNNLLDVRLTDVPSVVGSRTFAVEMHEAGYATVEDLAIDLENQLMWHMDAEDFEYHTEGAGAVDPVRFRVTHEDGKLNVTSQMRAGAVFVDNSMSVEFLFTSGPNAGSTPATVFGFTTEADTLISTSPLILGPVSTFPVILSPFRYIDVFLKDVPELKPMARIPLSGDLYATENHNTNSFRLLTQPIRNIQELHIQLTMVNGADPEPVTTNGFDFVFDLLLLDPNNCVPTWIQQQLAY
jgi:hypothetical protein